MTQTTTALEAYFGPRPKSDDKETSDYMLYYSPHICQQIHSEITHPKGNLTLNTNIPLCHYSVETYGWYMIMPNPKGMTPEQTKDQADLTIKFFRKLLAGLDASTGEFNDKLSIYYNTTGRIKLIYKIALNSPHSTKREEISPDTKENS